ncbi:MAG: tyrosine-protein phosphatase [Pseudomonadota bacterium]
MTLDLQRNAIALLGVITLSACANVSEVSTAQSITAATEIGDFEEAAPQQGNVRNVILMVSDGIGFNGWLATDYYQGLAGKQSYQIRRPDGTQPVVYGMTHTALNLIDESGTVLPSGADLSLAVGAVEQDYDPLTRWDRLENGFRSDYQGEALRYTSYTDSAAAGTALMSGRKTANGRINMDWSGETQFQTIGQIALRRDRAVGAVTSVMASHPLYIESTFAELDNRYGSTLAFIQTELDVSDSELNQIRERLLR